MSLRNRTAKRLCVTNATRLLLACFVVNFTNINVFWPFTVQFCEKLFQTKHACHARFAVFFPLPSVLRKFTNDTDV